MQGMTDTKSEVSATAGVLQAFSVRIDKPGWESAEFIIAAPNKDKAKAFAFADIRLYAPDLDYTAFRSKRAPDYDSFAVGLQYATKLGGRDTDLGTEWGCCAAQQPPLELVAA